MQEQNTNNSKPNNKDNSHLREAWRNYVDESKKIVNEVYLTGLEKINLQEEELASYRAELVTKIKQNPLKSVLIAGGLGYLLAKVLKK